MSRKLATRIKDSAIPGKYKRVLEAYAAFANNDGTNIYPKQPRLAAKASCSVDTIGRQTPDLLACGVLKHAKSHVCKQARCNKGATHWWGQQGKFSLVYEIDVLNLQSAEEYLSAKCGKVKFAECGQVLSAKCGTDSGKQQTPVLGALALGQTPDHSAVPLEKETKKETPLATLAPVVVVLEDKPSTPSVLSDVGGASEEKTKTQPQEEPLQVSWRCAELEKDWTERTRRTFSGDELIAAERLIQAHGSRVVKAVLHNTLWDRDASRKMRWNNFLVFSRNWERNHDEYLAFYATHPGVYATKFRQVMPADKVPVKKWLEHMAYFKQSLKIGEWTISEKEWEIVGLHRGHAYAVLQYLVEDEVRVTKERFSELMFEAAGSYDNYNAFESFDVAKADGA